MAISFTQFRDLMAAHFEHMTKDVPRLYTVDVEKDEMWNMGGYYICQNCAEDGDYIYDEGSGELYYEDDYWDMMHEREYGY